MGKIEIVLYGNPTVYLDGKKVFFPYKKSEGLLYYLAVKKNISREEAVNLLWCDENENKGKKKLRDAIYQIRKLLGKDFIIAKGHSTIKINEDNNIEIDFDESKKNFQDMFLGNFYIKDCYEFGEWVEQIRQKEQISVSKSNLDQLQEAFSNADIKLMQKCTNLLIKNDPFNENLYYDIMDKYASLGNYSMAIRIYYDLVKVFKKELNEKPSKKTIELFHRIFNLKERFTEDKTKVDTLVFERKRELFEISGLFDQKKDDKMNIVAVEGEEGIGKTTFLDLSAKYIKDRKYITLKTVCYSQSVDFFLSSWNDIFHEIVQLKEEGALNGILKDEDILKIKSMLEGRSFYNLGEGLIIYQNYENTAIEIFKKITDKFKILLIFDEIQWMDKVSFKLLIKLANEIETDKLKIIFSYDKIQSPRVIHEIETLVREDRIKFIYLLPLTYEETAKVIDKYLPELKEDKLKKREIYEMTGGNLFFLNERINFIRKNGYTNRTSPKTNFIIESRLSEITGIERKVLDAMSVFPEKISIEGLEILLNTIDRLDLIHIIDKLRDINIIEEILVGWNVYYKFVHRIFQEYIYNHQSEGKKQQYHRMIANYFEKIHGKNFVYFPLIAYHYEKCRNEQVKAYKYEIKYLQEFYTITNENFPIINSEVSDLGEDFYSMAKAEKMLGLAENVIKLQTDTQEVNIMKMKMYYIKGRYDIANGNYKEGIDYINKSIDFAKNLNSKKDILSAYKQLIFYGIQSGDINVIEKYVEKGLNLTKKEGKDEYGTFLRLKGYYFISKGLYDEAYGVLNESLKIFKDLDIKSKESIYKSSISACLKYLGDIERKKENYENALFQYNEALKEGQSKIETNGIAQVYSNIGQVMYIQGRYAESFIYLDRARESLEKNDYIWGLERTEIYLGFLFLKKGDKNKASYHYNKAKTFSSKIKNPKTNNLIVEFEKAFNSKYNNK